MFVAENDDPLHNGIFMYFSKFVFRENHDMLGSPEHLIASHHDHRLHGPGDDNFQLGRPLQMMVFSGFPIGKLVYKCLIIHCHV